MRVKAIRRPMIPKTDPPSDELRVETLLSCGSTRLELNLLAPIEDARISLLPGRVSVRCEDITIELPHELVDRLQAARQRLSP